MQLFSMDANLNSNLFLTYTYHMTSENFEYKVWNTFIMVHFRGQHFQILFTFIKSGQDMLQKLIPITENISLQFVTQTKISQ